MAPALIAATMGYDQLREMWNLVGRDLGRRQGLFMRETGECLLRCHYADVRMIDLPAIVEMSADDMRNYIANSVAHRHLASRVPDFDGTRTITASTANLHRLECFVGGSARLTGIDPFGVHPRTVWPNGAACRPAGSSMHWPGLHSIARDRGRD